MKKILFLIIPLIVLIAGILFFKINNTRKNYTDNIRYVDDKIDKTINDLVYENLSIHEKKEVILSLMENFKKDKLILNFSYDESNKLFSFVYCDNSLGGVTLIKPDEQVGDLPVN